MPLYGYAREYNESFSVELCKSHSLWEDSQTCHGRIVFQCFPAADQRLNQGNINVMKGHEIITGHEPVPEMEIYEREKTNYPPLLW